MSAIPETIRKPALSRAVPTTVEDAAWAETFASLRALRTLDDDWDGQGAPAPAVPLVDAVLRLAGRLEAEGEEPPTRAIAGLAGTVFLEWQTPAGYREIEVAGAAEGVDRWLPKGASRPEETRIDLR